MTDVKSMQNTVLAVVALLAFGAGGVMGKYVKRWEMQEEAKKRGFAWHSRTTGDWQWKTPEEYEISKLNADPIKLEVALRAMALPADGKILAEELTAPKPTTKKESHETN